MTRKTITWHEAAQMTVDELLELAVQNNLYKKRAVTFLTRDNLLRLLQSCGAIEDEHSRVEARSSSLLRGMRSHYSPERLARARYSPTRRDEGMSSVLQNAVRRLEETATVIDARRTHAHHRETQLQVRPCSPIAASAACRPRHPMR